MSTILKCKMCGGDIEVNEGMSVGTCKYCKSTITLPRIDSEKKARLFNRANQYRQNCEFDKAYRAYEAIIEEDDEEAEAYWGMVLAEYGVEYVEDSSTKSRIPTSHRTQTSYITDNTNYKLACKYADSETRLMYEDEAEELNKIQKQIIAISSTEEPYDVFICYKETDDITGERTQDSVLSQNIYDELEAAGIRTFFSRVSLETHLGENYEPYIFAALQSARIMLVVSTSKDNCEAVWVKNEWSRFLRFMQEDKNKAVIPVFQNMSPNHFPEELSGFQAQDAGKVGAIQDLVYGIKKLLGTTQQASQNVRLEALATAFSQKEEAEKKRRRKILIAVVCSILAIALIIGGFNIYKAQETESKLREVSKDYVGTWKSLDKTYELILNADGTCTLNGVSLEWNRNTQNGGSALYLNNSSGKVSVASIRAEYYSQGINFLIASCYIDNNKARTLTSEIIELNLPYTITFSKQ